MLTDKQKKEIEEIIGEIECPKKFICYESGFESLCKAEDHGLDTYLLCLDKKMAECKFSISYGTSYYCRCPLRVYISKVMKK